jgi:hypothetical protein
MMSADHEFEFKDFQVLNADNSDPFSFDIIVDLDNDKHDGWKIKKVWLLNDTFRTWLTEEQFVGMFPDGQDICNNAYEEAATND